jgi:hypothetical protein
MQPYFVPYIGYFQLLKEVDTFVLADNYEYSKGGWINRNRILNQERIRFLTLPLEASSDFSLINEKKISKDFVGEKSLNLIVESYRRSPYFSEVIPLVESILLFSERNLFHFVFHSLKQMSQSLEIKTNIMLTSQFELPHSLSGKDKIIKICQEIGAVEYINLPGGKSIYNKNDFSDQGVDLKFLKVNDHVYPQVSNVFVPNLSVLDVLFHVGITRTLNDYMSKYSTE